MGPLSNKIIIITGASSGIGEACAHACAREGARLILLARRKEKLKSVAQNINKEFGTETHLAFFDIRNRKEVEKFVAGLPEEWSKIDVLINNAGLARGLSKIHAADVDQWEEMIDTNIKGLLYMTRLISPGMVERQSGHIINIGSVAGHDVYLNGNVYCATKFAVDALSKGMRLDLLDKNIKVTSIDPGMVETEFSLVRFSGDAEKARNFYLGITPLAGADIAASVIFVLTRPSHVNITDLIITPTAQASATTAYKKL